MTNWARAKGAPLVQTSLDEHAPRMGDIHRLRGCAPTQGTGGVAKARSVFRCNRAGTASPKRARTRTMYRTCPAIGLAVRWTTQPLGTRCNPSNRGRPPRYMPCPRSAMPRHTATAMPCGSGATHPSNAWVTSPILELDTLARDAPQPCRRPIARRRVDRQCDGPPAPRTAQKMARRRSRCRRTRSFSVARSRLAPRHGGISVVRPSPRLRV